MYYYIEHTTTYIYNQSVYLKPHLLRIKTRSDAWQKLHKFDLNIEPKPENISYFTDLDGNNLIKIWFNQATESLKIQAISETETYKENPFDYLLEPWTLQLPFDYPTSLRNQLTPYLQSYNLATDPIAVELAQDIYHEVKGETLAFLNSLNQHLYQNCDYTIRENGDPWFPGITWKSKQGSCRDVSILFMEVCAVMGLAARFVSGYQEGDIEQEERYLHAWVEVYLPGGGWRGYDPTHGLAVSDRHIALVASPLPKYTTPIEGNVTPIKPFFETNLGINSQMKVELKIEKR